MAEARNTTEGPAIGIDLGTTFSCVAVVRNGKVEVIANEQGNFTTPSIVAFNEYERMIGDAAKQQMTVNAVNTVFDAKRLIGRSFDDPIVQKDMQQWPFKVVDGDGMPKIVVLFKGDKKCFSAEEISAMVLGKMKEIAESYLNMKVTNAVVTVPAYFNDMQRKSTKDAGAIAGLNVARIINEPTAAAIAYGFENKTEVAKNILVYDLGGGTFDVSVLKFCKNNFEIRATGGDTHLGGEDFDEIVMKSFADEFKRKHKIDISGNKKALRKLRTACERAKRTLSSTTRASIEIESLCDGIDFIVNISRARFDDLCADLFRMTIKIVESTLKDADMKPRDIDTVVLVGGSTRIVKIQQLLQDFFVGKEICKTINPDEAVARGAAILAAIEHGNASKEMENMVLMEVTPLTLGTAVGEDHERMGVIIERNTRIPVSKTVTRRTKYDYQTSMSFQIMQGEHMLTKYNNEIVKFRIEGIPRARARVEKVLVTFSIDANGILTVSAVSKSNANARGEITIKNVCGSLTKAEIERMIAEAEEYREHDLKVKRYYTARSHLEQFAYEIMETHGSNRFIRTKCDEMFSWLDSCFRPTMDQIVQWESELVQIILPPQDNGAKKRKNEEDEEAILLSLNGVIDDTGNRASVSETNDDCVMFEDASIKNNKSENHSDGDDIEFILVNEQDSVIKIDD